MSISLRAATAALLLLVSTRVVAAEYSFEDTPAPACQSLSACQSAQACEADYLADDLCDDECDYCPVWTVRLGAAFLQRDTPAYGPLIVPTAGPGLISAGSEFSFDTATAADITISRRLASGNSLEFRYLGQPESTAHTEYGAVGNVRIGSFSNFGATNLFANYQNKFSSAELNWVRPMSEGFTFLAGLRSVELHELLTYNITFPAFNADYNWDVNNHLLGLQIGGVWSFRHTERLSLDLSAKGAVCYNDADNDFSLIPSTGGFFGGGGDDNTTSFVGDVQVTLVYQVSKHIALRGGYQMLWIDRVALSSDQLAQATANSTQAGISTSGEIFYSGFNTGIEVSW